MAVLDDDTEKQERVTKLTPSMMHRAICCHNNERTDNRIYATLLFNGLQRL